MKKGIVVTRHRAGIVQEWGHETTSLAVAFGENGAELFDAGAFTTNNPHVRLPQTEDGFNALIGILIEAKAALFEPES